ncbi:hypothetical protein, partial [Acididesulfobacillus acetoxydans]|uniref:hypothetical protein n=1 Tax=Acididesulfobacillus acetoxydans TaxID=1561005 RepID=UPI0021C18705
MGVLGLNDYGRFVCYCVTSFPEKFQSLRLCKNLRFIDRAVLQKAFGGIWLQLIQDIPDSGQEHLADSDDSLFVTPAGLDSVILLFEFRVFLRLEKC